MFLNLLKYLYGRSLACKMNRVYSSLKKKVLGTRFFFADAAVRSWVSALPRPGGGGGGGSSAYPYRDV